jgi:hypothetical protein
MKLSFLSIPLLAVALQAGTITADVDVSGEQAGDPDATRLTSMLRKELRDLKDVNIASGGIMVHVVEFRAPTCTSYVASVAVTFRDNTLWHQYLFSAATLDGLAPEIISEIDTSAFEAIRKYQPPATPQAK